MSNAMFHPLFLLFFFFVYFAFTSSSSSSLNNSHKCSTEQSLALLKFKQNHFSIHDITSDYACQDWLGSTYYQITTNWNMSTDCCKWDGVTCNHFTGDVIGLDLSCAMLRGTIHHNSTLFHLPRLQRLNIAYNDFSPSRLPHEIGRFAKTLTHLNISDSGFIGQVLSKISLLPNLVSLDLSLNWFDLGIEAVVNILQNSTFLKELSLEGVGISSVLPTHLDISSSLNLLNLRHTELQGILPENIFNLPYLEKLDLSGNYDLIGPLPKVNRSSNIPLKWLDLSGTGLSGEIPYSIGHLKSLNHLDLSDTSISGEIPYSIGHLKSLNNFILSRTKLSGEIPNSIGHLMSLNSLDFSDTNLSGKIPYSIGRLKYLCNLDLSGTKLSGEIPDSISHLKSLNYLDLSRTNLSGEIPNSVGQLKSLNILRLSGCSFMGSIPKSLVNLRHLTTLHVSGNMLNGTLPSSLFTLPSLESVFLSNNKFSGSLPAELFTCLSLKELSLRSTQLVGKIDVLDQGPISPSFRQLINLTYLELSFNNFTGVWDLDILISSLTKLQLLNLSYSGLSVVTNNANRCVNPDLQRIGLASCMLTVFPESLRAMKNLQYLDLSNNQIHGSIPDWAGKIGGNSLFHLNLSHNFITGLPEFQWNQLLYLHLKSNLIQGPFPISICNMSNLHMLDMSNNSLGGVIPQCIGNISSSIAMVDLGNNHLRGTIPNVYQDCRELIGLILNGNQLEGEVPSSLSNCKTLAVLDLGNNHLNGTFPNWLGALPVLQVLVLKANNFHGRVESSSMIKLPFPNLRVLDLSQNRLVGRLPGIYFQNFKAMKNVVKKGTEPEYVNMGGKYYSIIVAVKGLQLLFLKILVDYTIVDLSNNRFEREIPDVMGGLNSLKVLNLSRNSLTGRIPHALGRLSEIESLDLSWNQLIGEIPQSLADITNLAVLNLSHNRLVGRIPQGTQFATFETSFGGNPGLCGVPLPKKCELPHEPQLEADGDTESGFTWKVMMLGYGCGTLLGVVIGYLMLSTRRPKWFNSIADAGEHIIKRQRKKRRLVYIGK